MGNGCSLLESTLQALLPSDGLVHFMTLGDDVKEIVQPDEHQTASLSPRV